MLPLQTKTLISRLEKRIDTLQKNGSITESQVIHWYQPNHVIQKFFELDFSDENLKISFIITLECALATGPSPAPRCLIYITLLLPEGGRPPGQGRVRRG